MKQPKLKIGQKYKVISSHHDGIEKGTIIEVKMLGLSNEKGFYDKQFGNWWIFCLDDLQLIPNTKSKWKNNRKFISQCIQDLLNTSFVNSSIPLKTNLLIINKYILAKQDQSVKENKPVCNCDSIKKDKNIHKGNCNKCYFPTQTTKHLDKLVVPEKIDFGEDYLRMHPRCITDRLNEIIDYLISLQKEK